MILSKKINKFIAVLVTLILTLVTCGNINNRTFAENENKLYIKCDAKTGELLDFYILNALKPEDKSRVIIGTDDRVIDYTKSGVVKILPRDDDYLYSCTGFVVDEHVIATSAHGVVDNKRIHEILLYNTDGTVAMKATPVEIHIPSDYNQIRDTIYDYALITVKENLSDYMCFNLAAPVTDLSKKRCGVSTTGFPGSLTDVDGITKIPVDDMYTGNGIVTAMNDNVIEYNADTSAGDSGCPVYITEARCGYTYYSVIAIHSVGVLNSETKEGICNRGTKITTDLIHFYKNNEYINY